MIWQLQQGSMSDKTPEKKSSDKAKSKKPLKAKEHDYSELVDSEFMPENAIRNALLHSTYSAEYSGPIPPPTVLEDYERVQKGSIDWIYKAADEERAHRHHMEILTAERYFTERRRGQDYAFGICTFLLFISAMLAYFGEAWPSALLGSGGLTGLAYVFIQGRRNERRDEAQSDELD